MDDQDELGAHVSAAGRVENTPRRAREIGSVALQLFTKQAQRWHEPSQRRAQATGHTERARRRPHGDREPGDAAAAAVRRIGANGAAEKGAVAGIGYCGAARYEAGVAKKVTCGGWHAT